MSAWPEEPGPAGQGCRAVGLWRRRLRGVLETAVQRQCAAAVAVQLVKGWSKASEYVELMSEPTTGRSTGAQADVHCSKCTFCQKLT